MSKQAFFIVYDTFTGDIKRHGKCPAEHVQSQARAARGEAVMLDTARPRDEVRELFVSHRVVQPKTGTAPYLRQRAAAETASRRPKQLAPPPTVEDLMRALASRHGITLSADDLAAARRR